MLLWRHETQRQKRLGTEEIPESSKLSNERQDGDGEAVEKSMDEEDPTMDANHNKV